MIVGEQHEQETLPEDQGRRDVIHGGGKKYTAHEWQEGDQASWT